MSQRTSDMDINPGEFNNNFLTHVYSRGKTKLAFPVCTLCVPIYIDEETRRSYVDLICFERVNRTDIFDSFVEFTRIPWCKSHKENPLPETGRMKLEEWARDKNRIWIIMLGAKTYPTRGNAEASVRVIETSKDCVNVANFVSLLRLYTVNHLLASVPHVKLEESPEAASRDRLIYFLNELSKDYSDAKFTRDGTLSSSAFECLWRVTRKWFTVRKSFDSACMMVEDDYFCPPYFADTDQQIGEYFRFSIERFPPSVLTKSASTYRETLGFVSFDTMECVGKWLSHEQDSSEGHGTTNGHSGIVLDAYFRPVRNYIAQSIFGINYIHGNHIDEWVKPSTFFQSFTKRKPQETRRLKYI